MWEIPYICFSIVVLCPSWYQTILLGLLCAVFVFSVMCVVCHLRMRMVAKANRVRFEEGLAERIRIADELQDTMLQTIQGSKFVADAALEKLNDSVHMRLTLEKLSSWLGQAIQEGQAALNSLRTLTTETNDHQSKSKRL
jgi:signal transduction histidine kinase